MVHTLDMESNEAPRPMKATLTEGIRKTLVARIQGGHYQPGERLPGEVDLARELDVSIAPIRAALGQLVTAGLIHRRAGSGTYVSPEPIQHELATWTSFTQELRRLGVLFETKVRCFEVVESVPDRVQGRFTRLQSSSALHLERSVAFDGRTRIFTRSWFRDDVIDLPGLEYFTAGNSLYGWFRQQGEEVVFAETKLQVTSMDDELAAHFDADWGTPVVLLAGTAYTRSGQIEYSETFYDHTSFSFTATYATKTGSN